MVWRRITTYIVEKLRLNLDELRTFVLKTFNNTPETQYIDLCDKVALELISEGVVKNPTSLNHYGGDIRLSPYDEERTREIIWDLVIERVVTIGINSESSSWPFLKLTEYGKKVVNSSQPIPHDPSGYLTRVQNEIPNLDSVILTYLTESIRTYNINTLT